MHKPALQAIDQRHRQHGRLLHGFASPLRPTKGFHALARSWFHVKNERSFFFHISLKEFQHDS
jgi:hypothetical protein